MRRICGLHVFVGFRFFLNLVSASGWSSVLTNRVRLFGVSDGTAPMSMTAQDRTYDPPFNYNSEVVGAFGRVGSFFLCHGGNSQSEAFAVSRGVAPGYLSAYGSPIFVATPSSAWPKIWEETAIDRREDLVFVGNGIPPSHFEGTTVVVPHFAILKRCRRDDTDCPIQTSDISPKTFIYGKHAKRIAKLLHKHGVRTEIVESFGTVWECAVQKLLWASTMWLVCHAPNNNGVQSALSVSQAHEQRQHMLDQLVDELCPIFSSIVGRSINRLELNKYLRDYSVSMPNAIPSKALAMEEICDRNGFWLTRKSDRHPQRYHQMLIEQTAGQEGLVRASQSDEVTSSLHSQILPKTQVTIDALGLSFFGETHASRFRGKHVVIVGGGMIGSSLSLCLARRSSHLNITVLDQLSATSLGKTTPASWAWLNANGKSPKSYQIFNQLGLHAWKHEPLLAPLVAWMGSLVRFEEKPEFVSEGGYPAEGPLSADRIRDMEPFANWTLDNDGHIAENQGHTYYFRDEGCVDPSVAVQTLKRAAKEKGVRFIPGANVTSILRDPSTGRICGVIATQEGELVEITADVIVIAAGAGSGSKGLECGFNLLHRPGTIAYASPSEKSSHRLARILVDPMRSSHVMQRPDGLIVAGGGALEVGGSVGAVATSSRKTENMPSLLDGAQRLSPSIVKGCTLAHTSEAVRPMPSDGLPIVGYVERGLYAAVTHSGITLGPLLSSMAAAEIIENVSLDILDSYRPSRFSVDS